MRTDNPEFKLISRAAYELPRLLVRLGDVDRSIPLSYEQRNIAKAAEAHAYNSNERLMCCIESLGRLLRTASMSEGGVENYDLGNIGDLLTHLAVEAQHLQGVESDMADLLGTRAGDAP